MFACGISSFTHTWMNLGWQKRLQSTSAMTYHALCRHRDTSHDIEARIKFPTPYAWGSNSLPPGRLKQSNARGMPGGGGGGGDVEASI